MPTYYGKLSVNGNQSKLDMALLLLEGFPDPTQAMYRATRFLEEDKGLVNGQDIWVNGKGGSIGTISVIVIDDAGPIGAAGPNLNIAFAASEELKPKKSAKTGSKTKSVKNKKN